MVTIPAGEVRNESKPRIALYQGFLNGATRASYWASQYEVRSAIRQAALKDNISANNSVILIFNGARYAEKNSG